MNIDYGIYDAIFLRLAIANFMDGTDKTCSICQCKYQDLNDCIERNVVVIQYDPRKIACFECYAKKNVNNK